MASLPGQEEEWPMTNDEVREHFQPHGRNAPMDVDVSFRAKIERPDNAG